LATEAKLDLVEVAPDADPPVCRILNYGKFRYEAERKAKADKRNRPKPPHQLKLRPQIAEHDYQTKKRQAEKFLAKGEKVRFTVQLRGRMNSHPQLGERLLERYVGELATLSSVEQAVRREGNQIHLLLAPRA
jgi:translation initiation factor IF-3